MKLGKLSLVAALAMTTSVFANDAVDKAIDSVKVKGHVKLWYQTMDHGGIDDAGLFRYDGTKPPNNNEWGDFAAQLNVTGGINDHLTYGVTLNGITSMGLEGHLVGAETTRRMGNSSTFNGEDAQPFWFHEAYFNYKKGNTNVKVGRQELDTPLAWTEKWNATSNSFEAALLTNTDLPDTTLVAAWVAKGNGATDSLVAPSQVFGAQPEYIGFMKYGAVGNTGGALVVAAINKSLSFMPVQIWGYHVPKVANAVWIQADASAKDMGPLNKASLQLIGASIGTQGATEDYLKTVANSKTDMTSAVAAKVAANMGMFNAYAAFSQTSEGNIPVANTATNYKKTKLPTASIFSDGMVAAQPDTTAFKVGAGANFEGIGSLGVSYGAYTVGTNTGYLNPTQNATTDPTGLYTGGGPASMGALAQHLGKDIDVNEIDVVFKTKVKDVDIAAMYIHVDKTYVPGGTNYGTYKNDIVRIVATLNF